MRSLSTVVAALVRKALWVLILALFVGGTGPTEAKEAAEKALPKQAAAEERLRTDAFGDPLPPGAVARLGTIRFRHEEQRFWQFAVSPDGRILATAAGRNLILWDLATGRQLRRFPFAQILRCLAFAPDGKSMAIGGEDCIVHRIDPSSGKELQRFAGHEAGSDPFSLNKGIEGVAFASDGRKLISWGSDKTVRVWEAHSGKELRQLSGKDFGSKDWFLSGLSPDGKLLAVSKTEMKQTSPFQGHVEAQLHLWDLETGKEVRQRQRTYPNAGMTFSSDGKVLAVSEVNWNRGIRIVLLDVESGKELRTTRNEKYGVGALAFSPDGEMLASVGFVLARPGSRVLHPCIHLWDVGSMKELRTSTPPPDSFGSIVQLAFSPDGKTLISRSEENRVRLWDVASGKERIIGEGPNRAIYRLAYSPNAKLVASASRDQIWLWSPITGKLVRILESTEISGAFISAMAFSADGKILASVNTDGMVQLWAPETGKEQRRIRTEGKHVQCVALAPDGEIIAIGNLNASQTLCLWNTRTGKKQRDIDVPPRGDRGGTTGFQALHFSPDSKTLYAVSWAHTRILRWDAASGKALPALGKHPSGIRGIALSPDGRSLAVITGGGGTTTPKGMVKWDGELYLWETATGQKRLFVKDVGFATSITFSPDGNLLALVNAGNTRLIDPALKTAVTEGVDNLGQVRLVRVADGKVIRRFTGHLGGINCVRFSPDGRTLASGGQDTTVLLWDVTDRAVLRGKEAPSLKPEKLAELWQGMRGTAAEAHGCMSTLISAPGQAVPFLSEKLKPIAALDGERFARLLKMLESDQFSEREEATQELKKLGDAAEPGLRKALQEKPPLETRRRLQALLDELAGDERLRALRAIEVLERIGDQPACDLLRRLSHGAAEAWLTEEARTTFQRLQRREKTMTTKRR